MVLECLNSLKNICIKINLKFQSDFHQSCRMFDITTTSHSKETHIYNSFMKHQLTALREIK